MFPSALDNAINYRKCALNNMNGKMDDLFHKYPINFKNNCINMNGTTFSDFYYPRYKFLEVAYNKIATNNKISGKVDVLF